MEKAKKVNLETLTIPKDIHKLVPFDLMQKYGFVPFNLKNDILSVVLENPNDINAVDTIRTILGYDLDLFWDSAEAVAQTLKKIMEESGLAMENKELSVVSSALISEKNASHEQPKVVHLVDKLLNIAVERRASDIHLEPQEDGLYVRFRIDGILTTIHKFPKEIQATLISRIKIIANMDITERRLPQDGQITMTIKNKNIDFRVSTLPGKHGEKTVIRVLDKSSFALDLSQLGFEPTMQSIFETMILKPQGIILVTGPTGSGKTTTLYSVLNRLRSPLKNVITLEDPIEYELLAGKANESGITQVQINHKIGMTFAAGLRASLRQDPDIIMVGEIRDKDTAEIAMKASLTGHLVLSTLHSNDATGTLLRLKDMGIEPYLISSTIIGVLAQRLVRVLCPNCKEEYTPPQRALKLFFPNPASTPEKPILYRAKGCAKCDNSGYVGRKGIFELITMTEELKQISTSGLVPSALTEYSKKAKIKSLRESGLDLVRQGLTTTEEIFRVTSE
ncbi:MAG: type II/IV secretion system protein [Endomicrobiales bacterium]|nr:type II/IV secretion system protein [Endomicrobiales bacterium]